VTCGKSLLNFSSPLSPLSASSPPVLSQTLTIPRSSLCHCHQCQSQMWFKLDYSQLFCYMHFDYSDSAPCQKRNATPSELWHPKDCSCWNYFSLLHAFIGSLEWIWSGDSFFHSSFDSLHLFDWNWFCLACGDLSERNARLRTPESRTRPYKTLFSSTRSLPLDSPWLDSSNKD